MKKSTLGSIIALAVILYGVNTISNKVVLPDKIKKYETVEEVVLDHLNFYDIKMQKEESNIKLGESELKKLDNAIYQTSSNRFILSKKKYSFYSYLDNNFRERINSYKLEDLDSKDIELLNRYYDINYTGIPNYKKPEEIIFKNLTLNNKNVVIVVVNEGNGYVVDGFLHLGEVQRRLDDEGKQ